MRSHGLNALAPDRQHQPRAVATKWLDTISVSERLSHQGHVLVEPLRMTFHRIPHNLLEDKRIMPYFLTQWYFYGALKVKPFCSPFCSGFLPFEVDMEEVVHGRPAGRLSRP